MEQKMLRKEDGECVGMWALKQSDLVIHWEAVIEVAFVLVSYLIWTETKWGNLLLVKNISIRWHQPGGKFHFIWTLYSTVSGMVIYVNQWAFCPELQNESMNVRVQKDFICLKIQHFVFIKNSWTCWYVAQ